MASNAERAATLVRALEASMRGDSSVVAELYTENVRGWAPSLSVSSAVELAVELENREDAFSEVELDVTPLDVSGDRPRVEWVVTLTHRAASRWTTSPRHRADGYPGHAPRHHDRRFRRREDQFFRQYWDEIELWNSSLRRPKTIATSRPKTEEAQGNSVR